MTSRLPLGALLGVLMVPGAAPAAPAGGELLWERTEQLEAGRPAVAAGIVTTRQRVVVAGSAQTGTGTSWWVRAYDPVGALVWEDVRAGAAVAAIDRVRDVVFVTGYVQNPGGDTDVLIVAYSGRAGTVLWEDRFDSGGDDAGTHVAGARNVPSGGMSGGGEKVAVAGRTTTGLVVRTYQITGELLWSDELPGARDVSSVWLDDFVFVCGRFGTGASSDWLLRRYQPKTGQLRAEFVDDIAGGEDRCLRNAGPGGEVWTAGFTTNEAGNSDFTVRTYTTPFNIGLILSDVVDLAGGDDRALALTYRRNRGAASGHATDETGRRGVFNKVYDLVRRTALWSDLQHLSAEGDDEATVSIADQSRLYVGGTAADHPFSMAYRWSPRKQLMWSTVSARSGTVTGIATLRKAVVAVGAVAGADGADALWVAAYAGR